MIDTHAHFPTDNKIEPEWTSDVGLVVLAGTNLKDSFENITLSDKYGKLKPAVGYHPERLVDNMADLKKLVVENRNKIVAIGECGLDILATDIDKQQEFFEQQIRLALDYDLPLIIHCRKLNDELVEILKKYPKHRGVFHCYTGGKKRVSKILDLGEWYFGIDGNLTYELGMEEVVKTIPQERLVLETDSPYLTPLPFRGEVNRPTFVEYIYKKVAEIWGKSFADTEKQIDLNAKKLFSIIG